MKNILLESTSQMPFHTDMRLVFDALKGEHLKYNWLITNIEYVTGGLRWGPANGQIPTDIYMNSISACPTDRLDTDIVWISGTELDKIIYGNNIQFIWGVFSAFDKGLIIDIGRLEVEPFADGNPNFWNGSPEVQHPHALFEIVCWDSTSTLFISRNKKYSEKFFKYFMDSVDLDNY